MLPHKNWNVFEIWSNFANTLISIYPRLSIQFQCSKQLKPIGNPTCFAFILSKCNCQE